MKVKAGSLALLVAVGLPAAGTAVAGVPPEPQDATAADDEIPKATPVSPPADPETDPDPEAEPPAEPPEDPERVLDFEQSAFRAAAEETGDGEVLAFYEARDFRGAWDAKSAKAVVEAVGRMDAHGLDPMKFETSSWRDLWWKPAADEAARAGRDVGTTATAISVIRALRDGVAEPGELHPKWEPVAEPVSHAEFLAGVLGGAPDVPIDEGLEKAAPKVPAYAALREALVRYRAIEKEGGWEETPEPPKPVAAGDLYDRVPALRERLKVEGDLAADATIPNPLPSSTSGSETLDEQTAEAVGAFQARHGIVPDNILGPNTVAELNRDVTDRITAIKVNLERLRWMPESLPGHRIEVNVPSSELRAFKEGEIELTMRVIVGSATEDTPTPVFHDEMEYVIFRPYWNVPLSIAKDEIVPKQKENSGLMAGMDYEIVSAYGAGPNQTLPVTWANLERVANGSLFIRQRPSSKNALGRIKFIFPNDSAVYLHDTPTGHLFAETDRDFSHGCVRVEKPADLASWVLPGWEPTAIAAHMSDDDVRNKQVNLPEPIKVYLTYYTVTVPELVHFDQDIYGHDRKVAEALGVLAARAGG